MIVTRPGFPLRAAPLIGVEYLVEVVEGEGGKPIFRSELSETHETSTVLKEASDVIPYLTRSGP